MQPTALASIHTGEFCTFSDLHLQKTRAATSLFAAQVLVDLSCGSGLFARRFAKSGRFAGVVATDFSENMLRQAKQNFDADSSINPRCGPPQPLLPHNASTCSA